MSDILDLSFTIDGDFYEGEKLVSPGFHIDACMYKPRLKTFFGVCEEKYTDDPKLNKRLVIGTVFGDKSCGFLKISDYEHLLPLFYNVENDGSACCFPFEVSYRRRLSLRQRDDDDKMIYTPDFKCYRKATVKIGELEHASNNRVSELFDELDDFLSETTLQNRILFFDFYTVIYQMLKELELFRMQS